LQNPNGVRVLDSQAVAQDGKVITIDTSDAHISLAQTHWAEAGVNEKVNSKSFVVCAIFRS